jgi:hypothetical protein
MKQDFLKFASILFCFCISLLLTACIKGKGDLTEQNISISDAFRGVLVKGDFDVTIILGGSPNIVAKGHQNIIDRLITKINNGVLELELERGNYSAYELNLQITMPIADYFGKTSSGDITIIQEEGLRLDSLHIFCSGSGHIKGLGAFLIDGLTYIKNSGSADISINFESGQLDAENSGSGDLNLNFSVGESKIKLSGAGNANLSGFAPTQHITNSGNAYYRAFNVHSAMTTAQLSGSGSIECKVSSQLNANLSGSGDLLYKGSPIINSTVTGTGIIRDAN